jgi:hypothetical protein
MITRQQDLLVKTNTIRVTIDLQFLIRLVSSSSGSVDIVATREVLARMLSQEGRMEEFVVEKARDEARRKQYWAI